MHMYSARFPQFQQGFIFLFLAVISLNVLLDLGQHLNIPKHCCIKVKIPRSIRIEIAPGPGVTHEYILEDGTERVNVYLIKFIKFCCACIC